MSRLYCEPKSRTMIACRRSRECIWTLSILHRDRLVVRRSTSDVIIHSKIRRTRCSVQVVELATPSSVPMYQNEQIKYQTQRCQSSSSMMFEYTTRAPFQIPY